jgi:hypothetical protein
MSLGSGRNINIDSLPDNKFLRNPLLTRADAPAKKTSSAPGRGDVVTKIEPGRAFFNRRAAAPPPQPPSDDSSDDSSDDDDDGPPLPRQMRTLRDARGQHRTGPFSLMADTNKAKLTFMVGFTDLCGATSSAAGGLAKGSTCASATVTFKEILANVRNPRDRALFERLEPTRTVPISIRLMGCSFGEGERHCTMEIKDANGRLLNDSFVSKLNSAPKTSYSNGYPLFLFSKEAENSVMFNPPALSADHKSYWAFDMNTLSKDTSEYTNPTTRITYAVVKKESKCAKLLDWALSVKNDIVREPRLLLNPAYCSVDEPDNLRIPKDMYINVCNAYKKKLDTIQENSFDLSAITVELRPLELSTLMKTVDLRTLSGYLVLEVFAHIPNKVDLDDEEEEDVADYLERTVAGGQAESDSDDDEEL